jgi:hypothetical protein
MLVAQISAICLDDATLSSGAAAIEVIEEFGQIEQTYLEP